MVIDATFWVAISFLIFIGALVYLKIPQKINELLNKLILDIKNEIDELITLYGVSKSKVLINYIRRFQLSYQKLQEILQL